MMRSSGRRSAQGWSAGGGKLSYSSCSSGRTRWGYGGKGGVFVAACHCCMLHGLGLAGRMAACGTTSVLNSCTTNMQVRAFLLRRMAAAASQQPGGSSSSGSSSSGSSNQRVGQLEALLRQTEVTPAQLQDLMRRAELPQEQRLLVQRSLGLAEWQQAVCYGLPRVGGEALAACAPPSEHKQLGSAALDGQQFAAALHQLVWCNPAFAQAPVRRERGL